MASEQPSAALIRTSALARKNTFRVIFVAFNPNKPPLLNHPAFFLSLNEAGSSVVDVDGLKLEFVFLNEKGEKRDWFTIVKE